MTHNNTLLQLSVILKHVADTNGAQGPWLVGGCVRDQLLGVKPKDFDLAVDYSPELAEELLRLNDWAVKPVGMRFEVLHVSKNGEGFEIARFRNDGPYVDGKPSWVTPGTMEQDSARRDFTVNSLYLDPFSGAVTDPTGQGLADVRTRTLRFVGRPLDRLREDPMRVFRFYRFLSKGFTPVPGHLRAVRTHFKYAYDALNGSGAEGVRTEIEKLSGAIHL